MHKSQSLFNLTTAPHAYVSNHMKTKQIKTPPTTHSNQIQLFHD